MSSTCYVDDAFPVLGMDLDTASLPRVLLDSPTISSARYLDKEIRVEAVFMWRGAGLKRWTLSWPHDAMRVSG